MSFNTEVFHAVVKRISPRRKACRVLLPVDFDYKYVLVALRDGSASMRAYVRKTGHSFHVLVPPEWEGRPVVVSVIK